MYGMLHRQVLIIYIRLETSKAKRINVATCREKTIDTHRNAQEKNDLGFFLDVWKFIRIFA